MPTTQHVARRAPRPVPAGRCLTDVWALLPIDQRRLWVVLVSREARAVRIEAALSRPEATALDVPRIEADTQERAREGARHQAELMAALGCSTTSRTAQ